MLFIFLDCPVSPVFVGLIKGSKRYKTLMGFGDFQTGYKT